MSGVSLVGLPALQALLYHCQYFQHVAISACNCYQGRYTFHLQAPADPICGPDPQTVNLFGEFFFLLKWLDLTAFMSVSLHIMCLCWDRFRKFSVLEWHTSIRWQLQETLQLSLHIQHRGQPFSSTPRHRLSDNILVSSLVVSCVFCCRLQVRDSVLQGPSPRPTVTEDAPASRLMAQGRPFLSMWLHAHFSKDWLL